MIVLLTGHLAQSQNLMPLALLLLLQGVLAWQAACLPVSVPSKAEPGSNPTFAEACGKQQLHTPKGQKNQIQLLWAVLASYLLEITCNLHKDAA